MECARVEQKCLLLVDGMRGCGRTCTATARGHVVRSRALVALCIILGIALAFKEKLSVRTSVDSMRGLDGIFLPTLVYIRSNRSFGATRCTDLGGWASAEWTGGCNIATFAVSPPWIAATRVRRRAVRLLVTEPLRAASALLPEPPASALRAPQRFQRKRCGRVHSRLRQRGSWLFA